MQYKPLSKEDIAVETPPVFETQNYDQFKQVLGNRFIRRSQVERIKRMMNSGEFNNFHIEPGKVNEHGELIDGQHRLEAAREANYPFYYQIVPGLRAADMIKMNSLPLRWSIDDYLHFYVENGYEDYIELQQLIEQYNINVTTVASIFGKPGHRSVGGSSTFKEGNFKINQNQETQELIDAFQEIRSYFTTSSQKGASALMKAQRYLKERDYELAVLVKAVKSQESIIYSDRSVNQVLLQFEKALLKKNIRVPMSF